MDTKTSLSSGDARPILSVILLLLDLLLLITLVVALLAWLFDPLVLRLSRLHLTVSWNWKPILALPAAFLLRTLVKTGYERWFPKSACGLWEAAGFNKSALALAVLILFFAWTEAALQGTRFDAPLPPIIIQGQDEQGGLSIKDTVPDAKLIYRLKPGSYFERRLVNSLGFREREVDPKKITGTIRVVCMGDSVTAQGRPSYSQYLHERLTNNPPTPQAWEAFHIGVHGYSSLQGLRLFQTMGRQLEPDLVTLYFGWNDHWLSLSPDGQVMGLEVRPWAGRLVLVLHRKRVFKALVWALSPVQRPTEKRSLTGRVLRVPPDEYRSTLHAFIREIRAAGAVPLLITAPRRSMTEALIAKNYALSIDEANAIHDRYVEITREVARANQAELLDLAALFAGPECNHYFAPDGIHFDAYAKEAYLSADPDIQPGLMCIASEIDRKIREIVLCQSWKKRSDHP